MRDELLSVELFSCLAEAKVLIEDWRQDYNQHRQHSALAMMTPARFALGYQEAHRAAARAGDALAPPGSLRSTPATAIRCRPTPSTSSHNKGDR